MTVRVSVAKARWNDGRPAEEAHLTAVRVATQHKGNAIGHAHHDVRLVGQQDDVFVGGNLRERCRKIIDAHRSIRVATARTDKRKLIAQAGKPKRTAVFG
jgi:hypothetical protein